MGSQAISKQATELYDSYEESASSQAEGSGWTNYDNCDFYEKITVAGMRYFAETVGLASGCDLKNIVPFWQSANTILEIGAGYGRVISYLRANRFGKKITAIERSKALFRSLQKKFDNFDDSITLQHGDIHNSREITEKYDVIFMLWSGIADFPPIEQRELICNLRKKLNVGGKLILDTLPEDVTPTNMQASETERVFKQIFNNSTVYTYSMTINEIDLIAKHARFHSVEHLSYYTDTNKQRMLHVLS